MSVRKPSEITTTKHAVRVVTARGWVTGSDGTVANIPDMTGSLVRAGCTDLGMAISYGSGSLGLPSGSIRLTLAPDNRHVNVMSWDVSMEGTASVLTSFAGTTGDETLFQPQNYRIVQYGHSSVSGTFDFGFVRLLLTGSAAAGSQNLDTGHWIGAVPKDEAHSNSPACTWYFTAFLRNTDSPT